MDFFSAVSGGVQGSAPTDDVDCFAHALAARYDPDIIPSLNLGFPSSPMANMSLSAVYSFVPVPPSALDPFLNDPGALILDIRSHAAHSSARLPRALSLSVPSTLLKRPLFSLSRLAAMLPSHAATARFSEWPSASRILVYDADATAIPDSSNIQGLLRKFKNDGFKGDLAWLQGGFQAVWRERRALIDQSTPDDDDDRPNDSLLRPGHLPISAFSLSSTTANPPVNPKLRQNPSLSIPLPSSPSLARNPFNPFFDAVRQNLELSHGITERIPLRLPRRIHRRIPDLPFPWLQDIAKKAEYAPRLHRHHRHHPPSFSPVLHPTPSFSSSEDTSDSDTSPDPADIEEGTEALAMQFYRIELAEQRRLMGVLERHSRESGPCGATQTFPYSITAGVEKGAKNRYRNIWPFEHARVRLHERNAENDDYVNASYVQPLGTTRRYIATQGPLEATFNDFWRLCWEQNVHVIVMLTREIEGSTVKCGSYWCEASERKFGPLTLKLVSKLGLPGNADVQVSSAGGGFFGSATTQTDSARRVTTIKRTFELSHGRYPHLGSRKVVQLQYLEWPDMNVPDDARGILGLIKEVEKSVDETWDGTGDDVDLETETDASWKLDDKSGVARHALGGKEKRPVLLHCSAGVGRTGGFIAVDAVLNAVRREVGRKHTAKEYPMDVDGDTSPRGDVLTVPIPVSGQEDTTKGAGAGLVMHVPAVVVPEAMQVDEKGPRTGSGASTREWVQDVLDQTGGKSTVSLPGGALRNSAPGAIPRPAHHRPRPLFKSTSSSSSSALPTDSDDSGSVWVRRMAKESSSLGTSISGSSEEDKLGELKRTESPLRMDSGVVSELLPAFGQPAKESQQPLRRSRTVSAPHTRMKHTHPSRAGSSTPWLVARRNRKQTARLGIIGPSSDDGPPPCQAMADEDEKAPSQVHSRSNRDPRHLLSKSSPTLPHSSSSPPDRLAEEPRGTTVDYKEPRRLHDVNSPASLSSFEEPIWEVVQDMREQRMSLCQSLRQYVFVHAAIIEGALMIVDEERERETEREAQVEVASAAAGTSSRPGVGSTSNPTSYVDRITFVPPPMPPPPHVPGTSFTMFANASEASIPSMSSTGKRGASPTELLKEGKKGEVLLSKRPSIKRKQTRTGERVGSDQRPATFFKQGQGREYHQGAAATPGLHLQQKPVLFSPSLSGSLS